MAIEKHVMGLFQDRDRAISTLEALKATTWKVKRVHGPFPDHKIINALKLKKSRVGYFTLVGGIIGFFSGMALAIFTATRWSIIVSGKPIIAPIPFLIVGFEFTILFAVLGNIIGLLTQSRLPGFKSLEQYDARCSGEHFGILAACGEVEQERLVSFFEEKGGEVRVFD